MKYLAVFFFAVPGYLFAQVSFTDLGFQQAIRNAEENNQLLMVYAYTEWCEPCEEMEAYTFTDLEVANFANENFLNLAMDVDDYPGVDLAERYALTAFPSFLFLNGKGEVVHRGCGAMDATEFLLLAEESISDSLTLSAMETRYFSGDRDTDFMLDYLALLDNACLDAERFAESYLNEIPVEKLASQTAWEVLASYQWDIYSREFQYLINNRSVFEDAHGSQVINAKIYDTYLSQYQEVFEAEELHDFGMRALLHATERVNFMGGDTLKLMMNLHYAEFSESWEDYGAYAVELVGMLDMKDPEELNDLAWKFYLFIDSQNQLEIAAGWARQAVDAMPSPSTIDTYASLQFKLGHRKQAIELEKKALELAEELYDDTTHYQHQLEKFSQK